MINNRFLRIQLKRIWIPILISGIIVGAFVGITLGGNYNVPYRAEWRSELGERGEVHNNSLSLALYYRSVLFSFLLVYMLICVIMLLIVEQDRGYIWSWLTSPMSRWTIFATKYLAMVIGLLIIHVWVLLLQLVLGGALMHDFDRYVGHIFLSHLDISVGVFFIGSLMWLIGSCFNRQWIPLLIISIILAWCGIATSLGEVGRSLGITWMKNMYYVSLFSLIHTPFERYQLPEFSLLHETNKIIFGRILPIRAEDYAWPIPIMFFAGVGCFIGAQFILKNKDYNV